MGLAVSADGNTIVVTPRVAMLTRDRGKTWQEVAGLPAGVRPIADRVNPAKFYALDFSTGTVYVSTDSGELFAPIESHGLPDISSDTPRNREAMWPLRATPDHDGDLWFVTRNGLYHSTDGGASFSPIERAPSILALSFGQAASGSSYPAIFCLGTLNDVKAVWRSDDGGAAGFGSTTTSINGGRVFVRSPPTRGFLAACTSGPTVAGSSTGRPTIRRQGRRRSNRAACRFLNTVRRGLPVWACAVAI